MIKSRPLYQPLQLDSTGRAHLIVSDMNKIPGSLGYDERAFATIETWVVAITAPGIAATLAAHQRAFRSVADLQTHLAHRLSRETVGFRLYAVGMEGFLWDVMNLGLAAGLGRDEVCLTQAGSLRRRVYCTHCKTIIEDVATNIVVCPSCQANLFVRDHFSRRLVAFMGVAVDAEVPGEIPAVEEVYSEWHE